MTERPIQTPVESARLEWRGECRIDQLEPLREQMLRALEDRMPVELDLSGVSLIDTAGLQLLLAFALGMRLKGSQLTLLQPSEALVQGAKHAGLIALLGL